MGKSFQIEFVEQSPADLQEYTLIEGFPGMGLVGTISAKYLVEKLNFKQIGYIDSDSFVPIIRIHKGIPVQPSRIYANEKLKLVVLISEQIIPRQYTQKVADSVVEWIKDKGIKKVISLAGITSGIQGATKIYGIAANSFSKKLLEKNSIEPIAEGITTGVTALILLNLGREEDIEAVSILGSIKIGADYKASAEILKKLNEVLGLNIDVKPLMKEAKETETELLKQLQNLKQTHENVAKIEDQTPMYT